MTILLNINGFALNIWYYSPGGFTAFPINPFSDKSYQQAGHPPRKSGGRNCPKRNALPGAIVQIRNFHKTIKLTAFRLSRQAWFCSRFCRDLK